MERYLIRIKIKTRWIRELRKWATPIQTFKAMASTDSFRMNKQIQTKFKEIIKIIARVFNFKNSSIKLTSSIILDLQNSILISNISFLTRILNI